MNLPPAFSGTKNIHAIIETPKGSRNKYIYENATGLFLLKKILPHGLSFPLDFGFIPHTKAEDGDPMDVLVIMDDPGFPGCLVECRVIGIMTAEQEKKGKMIRNDRVLAVAAESRAYSNIKSAAELSKEQLDEVCQFFENYHKQDGNKFKVLKIADAEKATSLIKKNLIA